MNYYLHLIVSQYNIFQSSDKFYFILYYSRTCYISWFCFSPVTNHEGHSITPNFKATPPFFDQAHAKPPSERLHALLPPKGSNALNSLPREPNKGIALSQGQPKTYSHYLYLFNIQLFILFQYHSNLPAYQVFLSSEMFGFLKLIIFFLI